MEIASRRGKGKSACIRQPIRGIEAKSAWWCLESSSDITGEASTEVYRTLGTECTVYLQRKMRWQCWHDACSEYEYWYRRWYGGPCALALAGLAWLQRSVELASNQSYAAAAAAAARPMPAGGRGASSKRPRCLYLHLQPATCNL